MALISNFALKNAGAGYLTYRSLSENSNLASRVQANMLMTRLGVKEYIISGADSAIDAVNERIAMTKEQLENAINVVENTEHNKGLVAIFDELGEYALSFNKVVELHANREKAAEKTQFAGDQLSEQITFLISVIRDPQRGSSKSALGMPIATQAQAAILKARLLVAQFGASGKITYAASARAEISNAEKFLKRISSINRRYLQVKLRADNAIQLLHNFQRMFDLYIGSVLSQRSIIRDSLDFIGPRIASLAEHIKLDIKNQQHDLGIQTLASIKQGNSSVQILALASIIAAAIISYIVARSITSPISRLIHSMKKIAQGEMQTSIADVERGDEVGQAAKTLQIFRDNAIERLELELRDRKRVQVMETLIGNFGSTSTQALSTFREASQTLDMLSSGIDKATEDSNDSIQEVASAAVQLSSSVEDIAENTEGSRVIAEQSVIKMEQASNVVERLIDQFHQISGIVGLISDIATQTNLLALNATIEASRAGVSGRGFAIVASEVKALAIRTSNATDEIVCKINDIESDALKASASMIEISQVIDQVENMSMRISQSTSGQKVMTAEIANNARQAAQRAAQVTSLIAGAGDIDSQKSTVRGASRHLNVVAMNLQSEIEKFLNSIKVA